MSGMLATLFTSFLFTVIPALELVGVIVLIRTNSRRIREKKAIPRNWRVVAGRTIAVSMEEAIRSHVENDALYRPNVKFDYSDRSRVYAASRTVGRPGCGWNNPD